MEFKQKLKNRLNRGIIYLAVGIVLIAISFIPGIESDYISGFGLVVATIGLTKVKRYALITKNESKLKEQEIIETDERNRAIVNQAKSYAFNSFVIIACIANIVLNITEKKSEADVVFYTLCSVIFLYWVSFFICKKKM